MKFIDVEYTKNHIYKKISKMIIAIQKCRYVITKEYNNAVIDKNDKNMNKCISALLDIIDCQLMLEKARKKFLMIDTQNHIEIQKYNTLINLLENDERLSDLW